MAKRKARYPELSYKIPKMKIIKVKPTEEEKQKEKERVAQIWAERLRRKQHIHKNLDQLLFRRRKKQELRRERKRKRRLK